MIVKITSVEPQKRNPKRFNIFLDGEFAFGADEDLVVDRRLVVGKEIPPEDLEKILFEAEIGKLMKKMYRLFNIRQRSEKEIRDYFKNLSFKRKVKSEEELPLNIINMVIELMKRKGMVNDKQFAISWMQSRTRKYGPQRIKQELYKKGIDREIIDEVFSSGFVVSGQEVAQKLLEKKIESWKNFPPLKFRKKAYEYLLRRGFEYSQIKYIIEKYLKKD